MSDFRTFFNFVFSQKIYVFIIYVTYAHGSKNSSDFVSINFNRRAAACIHQKCLFLFQSLYSSISYTLVIPSIITHQFVVSYGFVACL